MSARLPTSPFSRMLNLRRATRDETSELFDSCRSRPIIQSFIAFARTDSCFARRVWRARTTAHFATWRTETGAVVFTRAATSTSTAFTANADNTIAKCAWSIAGEHTLADRISTSAAQCVTANNTVAAINALRGADAERGWSIARSFRYTDAGSFSIADRSVDDSDCAGLRSANA